MHPPPFPWDSIHTEASPGFLTHFLLLLPLLGAPLLLPQPQPCPHHPLGPSSSIASSRKPFLFLWQDPHSPWSFPASGWEVTVGFSQTSQLPSGLMFPRVAWAQHSSWPRESMSVCPVKDNTTYTQTLRVHLAIHSFKQFLCTEHPSCTRSCDQ